jgi:hypothetical protein
MLRPGLSILLALFTCSCGKSDQDVKLERLKELQGVETLERKLEVLSRERREIENRILTLKTVAEKELERDRLREVNRKMNELGAEAAKILGAKPRD